MIALTTKRTRFGRLKDSSTKTGIPESKEMIPTGEKIPLNILFEDNNIGKILFI